ncbi:MAG: alpha-galactosidase [Ardenticatenaceae bacterium]|nr:alpha-galactosidase [Ardenticatenaceae bacterium]
MTAVPKSSTIFNALDSLLAQYNISFIKWDMNRNVSEPGSVVGKADLAGACGGGVRPHRPAAGQIPAPDD